MQATAQFNPADYPLQALKNSILFSFLDETRDGQFVNSRTSAGIIITRSMEDNGKYGRWALAKSVGPKALDVKAGDYILIEPLAWTPSETVNGEKVWRTTEDKVIAVSDERPSTQYL